MTEEEFWKEFEKYRHKKNKEQVRKLMEGAELITRKQLETAVGKFCNRFTKYDWEEGSVNQEILTDFLAKELGL